MKKLVANLVICCMLGWIGKNAFAGDVSIFPIFDDDRSVSRRNFESERVENALSAEAFLYSLNKDNKDAHETSRTACKKHKRQKIVVKIGLTLLVLVLNCIFSEY
jgi:hypothetical protein